MPETKGNPNQLKAITHTVGAAQVLAGPGSGKTFVTVERIRHLITHHGVEPANILVITFTKAAALEMQDRFLKLMEPERPQVWFGTFHAVFYHILKQSAKYHGFTIIPEKEKLKLARQIRQMHSRFSYVQQEDYEKILTAVSRAKNQEGEEAAPPFAKMSKEDFDFFLTEYQKYLEEFKLLDFDDIILCCERLLLENAGELAKWQAQFQYILIDEFQDIAPAQYRLMKLLALPQNNLFVVGDDDQSIYRFRGASPATMRQFMADYPNAEQVLLNVNYRCHRQIVNASLSMIGENNERFFKEIAASHEDGEGIHCTVFEDRDKERDYLLQNLAKQQAEGTLEQTALICRTNYECLLYAQDLEKNKIPYTLKETAKNPFQHFVVQDILAYMELAAGSRSRAHFLRIMNRPVRYLRRESLAEPEVSEDKWLAFYADTPYLQKEIHGLFASIRSLQTKKPALAVRYIRSVIGYDGYLTEKYGREEAKGLLEKAEAFQELAKQFTTYREMIDYISQYEEMLEKQKKKKGSGRIGAGNGGGAFGGRRSGERQTDGSEGKAEAQKGVTVLTMHASKGLEYDCVYLPGCEEGKIPSKNAKEAEEIEEERRMFYVAMTRAKKTLHITAVKGKTGKEVPSRFLSAL